MGFFSIAQQNISETYSYPFQVIQCLLSIQVPNMDSLAKLKHWNTDKGRKGHNRPDIFTGPSSH